MLLNLLLFHQMLGEKKKKRTFGTLFYSEMNDTVCFTILLLLQNWQQQL